MMKKVMTVILIFAILLPGSAILAYAKEENLALGKEYTIVTETANERSYPEHEKNLDVLTDGVYGDTNDFNSKWAWFYRATARVIYIDLGESCTVTGVETRFLQNNSWGIYAPRYIEVYTSVDGENYCKNDIISGDEPSVKITQSAANHIVSNHDIVLTPVCARYVAVRFDVSVNTFCDEIAVYGEKGSSLTPPTDYCYVGFEPMNELADPEKLGGDRDIVCFHAGYSPDNETLVNNTVDFFMPYVGYKSANGKITDTMFDSVMFLTLQGNCPSGGKLTIDGGTTVISDWNMLLDSYFSDEYNLAALDKATSTVKSTLGLPDDHTTSVYLTIPFPKISTDVFGDYTGDGIDDKIESVDDCIEVIKWFMDEVNIRWTQKGYKNLTLKGYFYYSESITGQFHDYEFELAPRTVEAIHAYGLYSVMIPFYQAVGIDSVYDIGYDAALMQPNLSFNTTLQDDPAGTMEDFYKTAMKYGRGIQMELADGFRWEPENYGKFYEQYLISASSNSLMTDTVHAYYNGAGPGTFYDACRSDGYARWIYDATYKFIKHTLSLPEDITPVSPDTALTAVGNERIIGKTGAVGDWYYEYKLTEPPKHGVAIFDSNENSFSYRADRNFEGNDVFTYEIYLGGKLIGSNTVNVTVLPGVEEISESEASSEESEPTEADASDNNTAIWLICISILLITNVITLASRRRKK